MSTESLLNKGSGRAASNETKAFLLNVVNIGKESQDRFIKECSQNPNRFEKEAIERQKLNTFSCEGTKRKIKSNGKVKEVKMGRDLFAKMLCLALHRTIDRKEVLKYPLTPVPLASCHFDGSLRDTPKSLLSRKLKMLALSSEPSYVDAIILFSSSFYLCIFVQGR